MRKYVYRSNKYSSSEKSKNIIILVLFLLTCYVLLVCLLPVKNLKPTINYTPNLNGEIQTLKLPSQGSSLVYSEGFGELATNNSNEKRPIASITKIITALVVLQAKPLKPAEPGPTITLTDKDTQIYNYYTSILGSTAPAPAGLNITEQDALTAMLLPSANNYADTLATWAYGSQENFIKAANDFLKSNNLNSTTIADASGFSPDSKSSANDLIILGKMVLDNPVLSQIVSKKSADIPGVGEVKNTNFLLVNDNVIGIKTGNTDEAKKCLLFASKHKIGDQDITAISVTLGQETFLDLANNTQTMLLDTKNGFAYSNFVDKNQAVGDLKTPWGETIKIIATDDLKVVTWQNQIPENQITTNVLSTNNSNLQVGKITAKSGTKTKTTNLRIPHQLNGPSVFWRLTHPLKVLFN